MHSTGLSKQLIAPAEFYLCFEPYQFTQGAVDAASYNEYAIV
jgi:hypothetical protein